LLAIVQLDVSAGAPLVAQAPAQTPTFRSGVNLLLVDVVVRERSGAVVTGLSGDDFELFEDGVRQPIVSCAFESIGRDAPATDGTAFTPVDASTASADEAAIDDSIDQSARELDTFNNDVRLRALKTLAEALQPIQQKKAIIYFSSGMQRSGTDNQVELRAAVNAAVRANVAIYPVDARGLQAVVPGGGAGERSRGGIGAFSGSGVAGQFTELANQQETLA